MKIMLKNGEFEKMSNRELCNFMFNDCPNYKCVMKIIKNSK